MLTNSETQNHLQKVLEGAKYFPCGPGYRNIRKELAALCLTSEKQDEGIEHLVESHCSSLHMKAFLKCSKYRNASTHVLDGLLVQPGGISLLNRLRDMPEEWTLLQISYTSDPEARLKAINRPMCKTPSAVHLMRLLCGKKAEEQAPYCITVPIPESQRMLSSELSDIIQDHQSKLRWSLLSQDQYYKLKSTLDSRMKSVVQKLETKWLGPWVSLFVGHYVDQSNEHKVSRFVDELLEKFAGNTTSILKNKNSRDGVRQLAKASVHVPEWELRRGLAEFLNLTSEDEKEMAQEIRKVHKVVRLESSRRYPVILLLDEELELFPWEMLNIILDHTVSRMPSLQMLHALYTAHKDRIVNGMLQLDVGVGYFIVNPQQNLPRNEKRLRPFLSQRTPGWVGTFGTKPSSHEFKSALQDHNVFVYSGHGCGSEFLQGDEIQKLQVRAVTFLFGCSSVTSKNLGGRVEAYGIWHFYQLAACPMVVGNLWVVTDISSDAITMDLLNHWLPPTSEMQNDAKESSQTAGNFEHEPELLYSLRRSRCCVNHYLGTASLVFRGLPITAVGSVEKTS